MALSLSLSLSRALSLSLSRSLPFSAAIKYFSSAIRKHRDFCWNGFYQYEQNKLAKKRVFYSCIARAIQEASKWIFSIKREASAGLLQEKGTARGNAPFVFASQNISRRDSRREISLSFSFFFLPPLPSNTNQSQWIIRHPWSARDRRIKMGDSWQEKGKLTVDRPSYPFPWMWPRRAIRIAVRSHRAVSKRRDGCYNSQGRLVAN